MNDVLCGLGALARDGRRQNLLGRSRGAKLRLAVCLVAVSCSWAAATAGEPAPLRVVVSILPQQYFVKRVGGAHVEVTVMVGPGESPATYEPKPRQLASLRDADIYLSIGVPFENAWLPRFTGVNADMKVIDMSAGIQRIPAMPHVHGGVDQPVNAIGADPHVWLAPGPAKILAQNTFEALVSRRPEFADDLRVNLKHFLADIDEVDGRLAARFREIEQRRFMVLHPTWGYFARQYDLEMIPIEVGGQEPSAAELGACVRAARQHGLRAVFVQPEFSDKAARIIAAETGGEVVVVSPLDPDWLACMERFGARLAEVLDGS